jgi:hypothetical protein
MYFVHTVFAQTRGRIVPEIMQKRRWSENDIGMKEGGMTEPWLTQNMIFLIRDEGGEVNKVENLHMFLAVH